MERRVMRSRSSVVRKTAVTVLLLAVALLSVLALSPAASAQTTLGEGCFFDPYGEEVCPDDEVRKPDTEVQAELLERPDTQPPAGATTEEKGPLPFTGADMTLFLVTGGALVVTGTVLVRRNRTRRGEI
jgi:hypothetical protein